MPCESTPRNELSHKPLETAFIEKRSNPTLESIFSVKDLISEYEIKCFTKLISLY